MRHSQLRGGDAAISWRVQYCSSRSQRALDTMPRCAATYYYWPMFGDRTSRPSTAGDGQRAGPLAIA